MGTYQSASFNQRATRNVKTELPYWLSFAALAICFCLAVISWMRLCSQSCTEGHNYRLYGLTFETVGLVFFFLLILGHLLSRKFTKLSVLVGWAICGALGSEIMLIYVQKYKIGSWCPVCLSIAATLSFAGLLYFYGFYNNFKDSLEREDKGEIMNNIYKGLSGICLFAMGFVIAFGGIAKQNKLQAMENAIKDSIVFGNINSPVEVYVFTDWACGGCRSIEPRLEAMAPKIMQKARLTFVDQEVHPSTLNFIPYNLSFMINNKPKYFELRKALTRLSLETKEPTDEQVEAMARQLGVKYLQLHNSDVQVGTKYFENLVQQLNVEGTPTIVVVSKNDKKGKKLEGPDEITESNVMQAIESLSKNTAIRR